MKKINIYSYLFNFLSVQFKYKIFGVLVPMSVIKKINLIIIIISGDIAIGKSTVVHPVYYYGESIFDNV